MLLQVSVTQPLLAERYRLIRLLGQGGMGRVWLARDEVLHRDVAIKEVIPPEGLTAEERDEMRRRTLREARAAARLNHPSVVRVYDVVRTDVHPWIVMEYVPSRSLHEVIAEDGTLPPLRVAQIGLQVLGALRSAHRAGVLHRDVKPSNVLLTDDGRVVLTDFGLATMPGEATVTRPGMVLGSPAYISPERARDGHAGPESDLWSLGATLYAGVEGTSPYQRSSAIATLSALVTEEPPPARHAGPLRPVLTGLLRKDPATRIDAEEAERLLRRAAGGGLASRLWPVPRPRIGAVRPATPTSVPPADAPADTPDDVAGAGDTRPTVDATTVLASGVDAAADATTVLASGDATTVLASGDATSVLASGDATSVLASGDATTMIDAAGAEVTTMVKAAQPAVAAAAETAAAETEPGIRDSPAVGSVATPADPEAAPADAVPADPVAEPADPVAELADPVTAAADAEPADAEPADAEPADAVAVPATTPAVGATPSRPIDSAEQIEVPVAARPLPRATAAYGQRAGTALRSVPRPWLLAAAVVVLALLVAALMVLPGGGAGSKTAHTPATPSPKGAPTSGAPAAPAVPSTPAAASPAASPAGGLPIAPPAGLPDGWQDYRDPTGFSLAVPMGWSTERDGSILYFRDPVDGRVLGIDQTDKPNMDPVADWTNQRNHRVAGGDFPGYREIGIRPVSYFVACADWEFTYDRGGGRTHAINRGFVTSDHQAYGIWWSTPDSSWQGNLPNFDLITRTFQPKP
jgi:hypothetical protein